ncbi:vWA domain-containing protein [Candidatus Pristimantibacillus sp. PTI5]|uniref:vWA domain-containing protein n=1 Tax=Candidatus Pristimantibacillus sp. PTI5 TaxID=3400422 RepID=UPI003B010EF0
MTRLPLCLVIDVSGSMSGPPIEQLNKGLEQMLAELCANPLVTSALELAVVKFGGSVQVLQTFDKVTDMRLPRLHAGGSSPMGEAVRLALQMLENRTKLYSSIGIDYYRPWLIVMTDGAPTDSIDEAAQQMNVWEKDGKINVFAIGTGEHADMDALRKISSKRTPLLMQELKFEQFFGWLSESITRISTSLPGQEIVLPSVDGWRNM